MKLLVLSLVFFFMFYAPTVLACEFSEQCYCYGFVGSHPRHFQQVHCQIDGEVEKFKGTAGVYSAESLVLSGNIKKIQPLALFIFGKITDLIIQQDESSQQPVQLEWDETTFKNVKAINLKVSDLAAHFPLPPALKEIGKNGLKTLHLTNVGGNIAVPANDFSDFVALETLTIEKSSFTEITGMNSLTKLTLQSNTISHFPQSINRLKGLKTLELFENKIKQYKDVSISQLNNLEEIHISGDDVKTAVESGFLNELPKDLKRLELKNGGLERIPATALSRLPQLRVLNLETNQISVVKKDDFLHNSELVEIILNDNPISQIEAGSLVNLAGLNYLKLRRTQLTSFDLRLIDGKHIKTVSLEVNPHLLSLNVDDFKYSFSIAVLRLANTGIRTLDAHLDEMLKTGTIGRLYFFGLQSSPTFQCNEKIHWMKKHIDKRLKIRNILCANHGGTKLEDYLKEEADIANDTDNEHKNSD